MSQEKFWTPEEDSRRDFKEQMGDYYDEQAEIAAAAHAKEKAESQRIENVKSHLLRSVDIPQKLGVSFDDIHKWYSDAMQRRNRVALDQDRFESLFAYENYDKSRFAFGSAEKGFLFGDVLNGVFVPSHFAPRTIDSCGSNGPISANSGGVLGAHAVGVTISDCFTTGDMAIHSGGIVGSWADSVTVQNAHASGSIGFSAGGIFGGSTFDSIANNTYSTGLIDGDAGGIFGESHSNPTVTHSYTSGSKFSSGAGILSGSSSDGVGNYSESNNSSSGWNTTHAASVMTGINTVWKLIQINHPYRLLSFNASPYDDTTQTISAGESSDAVFGYYNTCDIASISGGDAGSYADITIDADTGVVSTTNAVQDGTYNIVVSCDTLHDTYTLSTLELTVN